jgi:hypothetical protein
MKAMSRLLYESIKRDIAEGKLGPDPPEAEGPAAEPPMPVTKKARRKKLPRPEQG